MRRTKPAEFVEGISSKMLVSLEHGDDASVQRPFPKAINENSYGETVDFWSKQA